VRAAIGVTGGKGGTGKSMVAVNVATLISREADLVLADLDAEGANDHILLGASLENEEPVKIMLPFIRYKDCIKCSACANVCDTGAIMMTREKLPMILPRLCDGCRSCLFVCPTNAILEGQRIVGYTYQTKVPARGGGSGSGDEDRGEGEATFTLVTGVLREGEEHTPPVVIAAKRRAANLAKDLLMVDTGAGTANHVAIALSGSRLAMAVTEPTPLGLHDLELILRVLEELGVEAWVIVNRWGIGSSDAIAGRIDEVARSHRATVKARIPYSRDVVDAYVKGVPIVSAMPDHEVTRIFSSLVRELLEVVRGRPEAM